MKKSLEEIMNEFIDKTEVSNIDNEYYEVEKQFFDMFGHGVPREMLPSSITTDKIKEAMLRCIAAHSDNIFEELNVEISSSYMY